MTEEWRAVVGFDDYSVSNLGCVRSNERIVVYPNGKQRVQPTKVLKQTIGSHGYPKLSLRREGKPTTLCVHTIVAAAFIGPRPEGMEVAHDDGTRANCAASNLRYDTPKGNQADRILHGTSQRGARNPAAVLNAEQVAAIRAADGKQCEIAKQFGISPSHVSRIVNQSRWAHAA